MFDWNDEELTNIIWAEAAETDDHIVPYPEASEDLCNKKEWNQEASSIKLTEQKRPEAKIDFHGRKLGSSSNLDNSGGLSPSGYGMNLWPDLSLSSGAKTDQGSLGIEISKSLHEISKYSSPREEAAQPDKDAKIFQNVHEGKEQGDFIDCGWDNLGGFDDLDRIFRYYCISLDFTKQSMWWITLDRTQVSYYYNDDPIFGNVSIDNADELWSSKDASNIPAPISLETTPADGLRNRSEPLEIKAKCVQHDDDQSFTLSYEKIGGPASHDIQNAHEITVNMGYAGVRSKLTLKEQLTNHGMVGKTSSVTSGLASENVATVNELTNKSFGQKNLLKARKKSQGKQEGKVLQNFYGSWSSSTNQSRQLKNEMAPSAIQSSPSSLLGQQKQLQGAETLYQDVTNPYVASSVYGNLTNTYPAMPLPSQAQSGDLRHQPLPPGYEMSPGIVNSVKKSVDSINPLTMTPQEKIEKLRRRQQMQAMLAIQKQQQQLDQQVLSTKKSIPQKCVLEMQTHPYDRVDPEIEDLSRLPALDPMIEQDDSNTISGAVDDYFDEDSILFRLQDIISKLDIKIRLCIRDSLFRLAQSAMLRHYASDTSSTNKCSREEPEVVTREDSNCPNRYPRMPEVETQTNPIDRTVAHLLFHRPLDLRGNHPNKLESPVSAKIQFESKATNLSNMPVECLPNEDLKSNQSFRLQGFKNSCSLFEAQPMDQVKNSPCIDTSENESNNEPPDVGHEELEASQ